MAKTYVRVKQGGPSGLILGIFFILIGAFELFNPELMTQILYKIVIFLKMYNLLVLGSFMPLIGIITMVIGLIFIIGSS